MLRKLLSLFIFFSFITIPIGDYEHGNMILRRITFSDLFGGLAILFGLTTIFKSLLLSVKINKAYIGALLLLFIFFIEVFFSLNKAATLLESLIFFFLIMISLLIFYTYRNHLLDQLIPLLINTLFVASLVGFYDLIADTIGLPLIFPQRTSAEVTSGFRNAGQAGAYFMVFIAILYPLKYSKLYDYLSKKNKFKLNLAIIISIIFLFSTGKIAGWIGFVVGIVLFTLYSKDFKRFFSLGIMGLLLFFAYQNLDYFLPDLAKRLDNKVRTRIVEQVEGTSSSNFFERNWGGAIKAFKDSPLTGTGLGGFYGVYDHYEIHSTYLKMIGETGLLGVIFYIILIIFFFFIFKLPIISSKSNPYYDYLHKILPFLIGCFVSWTYTYHLRKREFWILFSLLLIVKYQAKLFDYNKKKHVEKFFINER